MTLSECVSVLTDLCRGTELWSRSALLMGALKVSLPQPPTPSRYTTHTHHKQKHYYFPLLPDAVDYISTTQTLVFNSGDPEMCVDIVIVDDDLSEQPETFSINLQSLSGEPLSNSMAGVTILSNDEG